jgi:hypothetical protein
MAATTWNFPTWHCQDRSPSGGPGRDANGSGFQCTSHGFGTDITVLFSLFIRDATNWPDASTMSQSDTGVVGYQGITSFGVQGETESELFFYLVYNSSTGTSYIHLTSRNNSGSSWRYRIQFGDEDGSSWLSAQKWYQYAFSFNSSGFTAAVNGAAPYQVDQDNTPSALGLSGTRWWHHSPTAAAAAGTPFSITQGWPSYVAGPAVFSTSYIDLSSQTVLDRIYDSDGNWKNPGQDGSLWFGDTYGSNTPEVYMLNGVPGHNYGSASYTFTQHSGGAGWAGAPGGLRKFYE